MMDFLSLVTSSKDVESNSIAPNTKRNYEKLLHRYESLAMTIPKFPSPFPLTEAKMRAFLEYYRFTHNKTTYGYIKQFISAFSYKMRTENLPLLTQTPDFLSYVNGLQRLMLSNKTPNAKLPITVDILEKIASSIENTQKEIEGMCIISLCFYGFLRITECLSLLKEDVNFDTNGRLTVIIKKSKTDQLGTSETIYINNSGTNYSPFVWLVKHLENVKSNVLFAMRSDAFREFLTKKISLFVHPDKVNQYSTHSLRKGAAYTAALRGVQDCQIKKMGRWRSNCYQVYTAVTNQEAGEKVTSLI